MDYENKINRYYGSCLLYCHLLCKSIKIVVLNTDPQMHCANCESKIKNNIRFEKGIKEIETNLADKTVTIKYDADKTTVEKIIAGFAKIHYTATVVENESKQKDDIRGK